jgi:hypothetical protein
MTAGCGNPTLTPNSASGTTPIPTPTPTPSPATSLTVSSPTAGAAVSSPFQVSATATACDSQPVSAIGYSIDQGTANQVTGTALQTQATAAAGSHTLHVLAWGSDGSSCNSDVTITVSDTTQTSPLPAPPPPPAPTPTPPPTPTPTPAPPPSTPPASGPAIPANAVIVSEIQQLPNWKGEHDAGSGPGSSDGVMTLVSSPSLSGSARQFDTSFTSNGGERYHVSFGSDPLASNFVYDGWLYVTSPADSIANVEMDMNQVIANGETVIYGFQCDGYSSTWDVTENAGTPAAPIDRWVHTSSPCNVQNWTKDTWHHIQVAFSRDDAGNVTYQAVWFDDSEQDINQTVPSAFALGWGSVLLTNFQIDGRGTSGSNTIYVDHLTVSRW